MMETAADPDKLRRVAKRLWVFANQMRETAEILSYPTGDLDAGVLEDGARGLEAAADEIERLRKQH
jgi:hypothetical protein